MQKNLLHLSIGIIIFFTSCTNEKKENFYTGLKIYKEFDRVGNLTPHQMRKQIFIFVLSKLTCSILQPKNRMASF